MPPRTARTLGIVLAVLGLVAVIVAIVLLVRPADGAGAPTSTPVAPSASAAAAPSTAPTEAESTETATQPTATDAPTETSPTETSPTEGVVASAAPAPAPGSATAAAAVVSFTASPATIDCAGDRTASVPVALSWQTEGGVSARLAVGTTDAQSGTAVDLSATGYSALSVPCRDAETLITLAVESPDGTLTQRTLVLPTD
ncbi:hypothetical protein [Rathayibacter festucae]|uniref:Uncharacterized protein n=1 Tax=Rathayibacter festucae DSM 15932 TaxID=1328866 RepID=A0A3T0T260_9MICO|nr:hypothetical protein [Rathayibacter festucae]AZZ52701.1 hypothetical protein C1I64_12045 [Rathayibacter festucae DSM 15932]